MRLRAFHSCSREFLSAGAAKTTTINQRELSFFIFFNTCNDYCLYLNALETHLHCYIGNSVERFFKTI